MPQQQTTTATRRDNFPIAGRTMELRGFTRAEDGAAQAPLATAEIVFTTGAAVRRYDYRFDRYYDEVLVVEDGAMRLDRLQRGAPLLNSHSAWRLEDQIGVIENPKIANGIGTCRAAFSRRESVAGYVQDVADGIIRNVSVGYVRHRVEMIGPVHDNGTWTYRVTDWTPYEVSLVPIPADMDSQVQRAAGAPGADPEEAPQLRTFPCEFIELLPSHTRALNQVSPTVGISAATSTPEGNRSMPQATQAAGGTTAAETTPTQAAQTAAPGDEAQRASHDAAASAAAATAAAARAADITELCARHGVADLAAGLIRAGRTVDEARAAVLDQLAVRDAASGGHRNVQIQTTRDETATRMAGIEQAILHRIAPTTQLDDNGRQFRGMSLLEIGREFLESRGLNTRGMDRMTLAGHMLQHRSGGMMGTSDFSTLFANVANRRLRSAYDENPGTYAMWARRAPNAPDFKNINVAQLSGAPDLLQTNEHGEFKYGSMQDGGEVYSVITYGRIVSLTRQAIVNDDLRAFERLVTAFGFASRRLENRLVYSQLTANANLGDGVALFETGAHKNLQTGAGSALQFSSLSAARTAMRLQKGLAGEELNLAPRYLIVPAALEQTAYQLTSNNYIPAKQSDVNEFRTGGRTALEAIVEPVLDGNSSTAWYLASDSAQVDTVEYCYLDGAEGPVIESEMGFETDGVSWKCRLDFAAKALDFRGLSKAAGA